MSTKSKNVRIANSDLVLLRSLCVHSTACGVSAAHPSTNVQYDNELFFTPTRSMKGLALQGKYFTALYYSNLLSDHKIFSFL